MPEREGRGGIGVAFFLPGGSRNNQVLGILVIVNVVQVSGKVNI